ncbi:MAG: hypothetical protein J7J01_01170 [Methanophagales archaeon]|nr:hypothetical protein [Methanophagales archaeon]
MNSFFISFPIPSTKLSNALQKLCRKSVVKLALLKIATRKQVGEARKREKKTIKEIEEENDFHRD